MGRITIFTAEMCPHSRRTKTVLNKYQIPYCEISVTAYPERLDDMIALSGHFCTPQVFFNTRRVGGADETIALLQKWQGKYIRKASLSHNLSSSFTSTHSDNDSNSTPTPASPPALLRKSESARSIPRTPLERFQHEIGRFPDPVNPRFAVPDYPPRVATPDLAPLASRDDNACIELPHIERATVLEVLETLKRILPTQDRRYNMTIYSNCVYGNQFVTSVSQHWECSRERAVQFGRHLQEQGLLHHVANDGHLVEDSTNYMFRLQCHHEPHVLNSYRKWPEAAQGGSEDCMTVLNRCLKLMAKMEYVLMDDQGRMDYLRADQNPVWPYFEEAVCELRRTSLLDSLLKDDDTKLAFGINLYNLMIKYAFMKVGIFATSGDKEQAPPALPSDKSSSSSVASRNAFFNQVKFNVGGQVFSFSEWEHGVLRGNRRAPYSLSAPLTGKVRTAFCVQRSDYRLHFALNCGAQSCSPVNHYTAHNLQSELDMVSRAYCQDESNVSLDPDKKEIQLNMIFHWYKSDFCESSHKDMLQQVIYPHLHGVKQQTLDRMLRYSNGLNGNSSNHSSEAKVVYKPYDWSVPTAKSQKAFDATSSIKANRRVSVTGALKKRFSSSSNTNGSIADLTTSTDYGLDAAAAAADSSSNHSNSLTSI